MDASEARPAGGFKDCSCGRLWRTREMFLRASDIQLVGYQVNFRQLELGLLLFRHRTCQTTLALPAGVFRDLYSGPVFEKPATGTDQCPEYCLHPSELRPCPAECECAFVREILQIVRNWPKASQG